jgi:cellulose synthase/poly-beta-1,6-N-acetylglucosamine synthase-like glycosyltransferase
VIVAVPGAVAALHLTVLSVAALFYRPPRQVAGPPRPLLFIIAARNEEALIGTAVTALVRQRRRHDLVVVVADRCTDRTAEVARAAGAEVIERPPEASPGKAAAINDGLAWAHQRSWDALVTIDADTIVGDGFVLACDGILQSGARVAQAREESLVAPGVIAHVTTVARSMQGVSLPRGREQLGLAARLKGPGMTVRREVIDEHPFPTTGISEDTRYGMELTLAGIVAHHNEAARLRSAATRRLGPASGQRLRWEAGRIHLARQYVVPLLRARTVASWDAALHLATPPMAVAVLMLTVGAGLAALAGASVLALVLALLVACLGLDVVIGLVTARAGVRAWAALVLAPAYIAWKVILQVRAVGASRTADQPFEPTVRD